MIEICQRTVQLLRWTCLTSATHPGWFSALFMAHIWWVTYVKLHFLFSCDKNFFYMSNFLRSNTETFFCMFSFGIHSCRKPTSPTTMTSVPSSSPCVQPLRSSRCMSKLKMSTSSDCCNSAAALCTMCTLTTNCQRCWHCLKRAYIT